MSLGEYAFKSDIWIGGIGDNRSSRTESCADRIFTPLESSEVSKELIKRKSSAEAFNEKETSRYRYLCSVALCLSYISLGFSDSYLGTSLLDLQYLYRTETQTILLVFVGDSVGYLLGAVIGGYLVDKLSHVFYFVIASISLATSLVLVPWVLDVPVLVMFVTLNTMFQGMTDTGAQVVVLSQWQNSKFKDSFLQTVHLMCSVGGTIGPFILEPFLSNGVGSPSEHHNCSVADTNNASVHSMDDFSIQNITLCNMNCGELDSLPNSTDIYYGDTNVQLGISTLAALCYIPAFLWIVAFVKTGCAFKGNNRDRKKKPGENKQLQNSFKTKTDRILFKTTVICLLVAFYFFYINIEQTTGNLLAIFVVKGLGWTKKKGPLITSVYWGVHGVGSLVGVMLAKQVNPVTLMYCDVTLMSVSTLVLLLLFSYHEAIVWLCIALLALGSGSIFAAGFSFVNQYLTIDGIISGAVQCSTSLSMMSLTPLTGYLFDTYGPATMVYCLFTSVVLCLVLLIAMHVFLLRCQRRFNEKEDDASDSPESSGFINEPKERETPTV